MSRANLCDKRAVGVSFSDGFRLLRAPLRLQRIGWVASRYALWETLGALGIEIGRRGIRLARGKAAKPVPLDAVIGRKLAQAFAKLGPTFVKLGQMLALRADFVGEPVANELRVLFDQVPPLPFRVIRRLIAAELGKKVLTGRFKSIDPRPIGSASLAQVHRGELNDGTPVVIKVQKPGAADSVLVDLLLLEGLARSADVVLPRFGIWQMFCDFKVATLREIDYREEARNIDKFRKNYGKLFGDADVVFPAYYKDLSTARVITLEPLRGKKVADLKKGSTVARKAAAKGVAAVLEQIFDHGFFHADPHSGNLFFQEDEGRIGFIDLGLVGSLNTADKRKFLKVLMAVLQRDRKGLAKALYELGEKSAKTDFAAFEKAIQALLDEVASAGLDKFPLSRLVGDLLAIARKNRIFIPNRYVLMLRAFLMVEGMAKSLDPSLSLARLAPPIVARSLIRSYNPLRFFRR